MANLNLKVNSRIEVLVNEKTYKALIIDVDDDDIKINIPVKDGEYLTLDRGETIEFNLYMEEGQCFNCYCKVLSRGKDNNVIYYKLALPHKVKKIQRRNFFRVSLLEEINYKNITDKTDDEIQELKYIDATMVNLSGGGVKIKTKEKLKNEDMVIVKISIKGIETELKGQIVRVETAPDNELLCGVKFLEITDAEADRIISELFEIMRKQRASM